MVITADAFTFVIVLILGTVVMMIVIGGGGMCMDYGTLLFHFGLLDKFGG